MTNRWIAEKEGQAPESPGASPRFSASGHSFSVGRLTTAQTPGGGMIEMTRKVARARSHVLIWMGVFAASAVGLLATYILFVEAPPPRRIVLAAGAVDGAYYRFAERYRQLLKSEGVTLEIQQTKGSVENLELLLNKDSDVRVAFVQSGVAAPDDMDELESLGSLYREPLWIFYRGTNAVDRLTQLAGQRIAIGPEGSGTRSIAVQLLEANGIEAEQATFVSDAGNSAADALENGDIDAAFFVAGIDAKYVRRLLRSKGIRLVELAQARAYERQFQHLSTVTIHAGLIDLRRNIPAEDTVLISPAATLVAHKSLHPALVALLLKVATKVHHSGDLLSTTGEFPSASFTDFPLNDEAERYFRTGPPILQRFLPFWIALLVDRMKIMAIPLIMLLMPLFKAAPPLVRWQSRRKIYTWYTELREIDQQAIQGMSVSEAEQSLESLRVLEHHISNMVVPLSYMEEFYNLRLHLNLVRSRVEAILYAESGSRPEEIIRSWSAAKAS